MHLRTRLRASRRVIRLRWPRCTRRAAGSRYWRQPLRRATLRLRGAPWVATDTAHFRDSVRSMLSIFLLRREFSVAVHFSRWALRFGQVRRGQLRPRSTGCEGGTQGVSCAEEFYTTIFCGGSVPLVVLPSSSDCTAACAPIFSLYIRLDGPGCADTCSGMARRTRRAGTCAIERWRR